MTVLLRDLKARYSLNVALEKAGFKPHQIPSYKPTMAQTPVGAVTNSAKYRVASGMETDFFDSESLPKSVTKQPSPALTPLSSSRSDIDDRPKLPTTPRLSEEKMPRTSAFHQSPSTSPILISQSGLEKPKELKLPESALEDTQSIITGDQSTHSKEGMPGNRILVGANNSLSHLDPSRPQDKIILDALRCDEHETVDSLRHKILTVHKTIQKTLAPNLEEEYSEEFRKRYRAFTQLPKNSKEAIDAAKKLHIDICRVYEKHYTPYAMEYDRKKKENILSLLIELQQKMAEKQSKQQNKVLMAEDIPQQDVLSTAKEAMLSRMDRDYRNKPKDFEGPEQTWPEIRGEYAKLEPYSALSHLYDLARVIAQDSHTPPIVTERWHNPTVNLEASFTGKKADLSSAVSENESFLTKRHTFPAMSMPSPLRTNSLPVTGNRKPPILKPEDLFKFEFVSHRDRSVRFDLEFEYNVPEGRNPVELEELTSKAREKLRVIEKQKIDDGEELPSDLFETKAQIKDCLQKASNAKKQPKKDLTDFHKYSSHALALTNYLLVKMGETPITQAISTDYVHLTKSPWNLSDGTPAEMVDQFRNKLQKYYDEQYDKDPLKVAHREFERALAVPADIRTDDQQKEYERAKKEYDRLLKEAAKKKFRNRLID